MTEQAALTSFSLPSGWGWTYDVFLNFYGEEESIGFITKFSEALCKAGIDTFSDDGKLKTMEVGTLQALQESRILIIVFSEDHAFSTSCLDLLVKVLDRRKRGQLVWPVFYKVKPIEVAYQEKSYGQALDKHKFKDDATTTWRSALFEAAHLPG